MTDDVLLNKTATIERCLRRIRDEYGGDASNLTDDLTRQDAIILNVQRACQAAIDLSMHLARARGLGAPQDSRDGFRLLIEADLLDASLGERLMRMVGFRNIAIHDYQAINLDIVRAVIEKHLVDFEHFAAQALRTSGFQKEGKGPS